MTTVNYVGHDSVCTPMTTISDILIQTVRVGFVLIVFKNYQIYSDGRQNSYK